MKRNKLTLIVLAFCLLAGGCKRYVVVQEADYNQHTEETMLITEVWTRDGGVWIDRHYKNTVVIKEGDNIDSIKSAEYDKAKKIMDKLKKVD